MTQSTAQLIDAVINCSALGVWGWFWYRVALPLASGLDNHKNNE